MGHRHRGRGLQSGNHQQSGRHHRNHRHRSDHRNRVHYYYALCLCAVSLGGAVNATEVSNIVELQLLQRAITPTPQCSSITTVRHLVAHGQGKFCNGPTLNVTPFYLGSETHTDSYTRSGNFGIQIGIAAPLDGSISEM